MICVMVLRFFIMNLCDKTYGKVSLYKMFKFAMYGQVL